MQAAFKYRETTPLSGLEAEPSSLQVSGVGPLRIKGSDPVKNIFFFFFFFFYETDMNCVNDKICL